MEEIHKLLDILGFTSIQADKRSKKYDFTNCEIEIDFNSETINYPDSIELGDRTTSNFENSENFVVLECVDRLLTKGYPPHCIELEHKYPLGRKYKGKIDILVKRKHDDKTYLMIECKTHPDEYEKEIGRMLKDGGQLFSYWQQDRHADHLCLYTSYVVDDEIKYDNAIVKIEGAFRSLSDVEEVFNRWNKQFTSKGLFEPETNAYAVEHTPLLRGDIRQLEKEDGNRIYQQFLEILRHNVVSDKSNAFNKIFNLFLCKIVDEGKQNEEQLEFQWLEGIDNDEELLGRLNSLYKRGMKEYLNKDVTDYTVEEIANSRFLDKEAKRKITELRLFKNQEFAFVEVFNEETFKRNAQIVIEMVRLLERWQIRYTHKHQFLGEFFELLLNTGFKQESGQFFTPVPLVQFIVMSLPIEDIVREKIDNGEIDFLPYTIDFACGSGHFLTETMDVIDNLIQQMPEDELNRYQVSKLKGFKTDLLAWAKEYVYGIELDYRLAKTSKLACFLNGDGEAQILHASGIDPFDSDSYMDHMRATGSANQEFDILVANPPYAVAGFKATVKGGSSSFTLFDKLGDKSNNIEVLFVERMAQLVRPGGVVGIVLPLSLIMGGGIYYEDTRKLLLEHFDVKGVVVLDTKAFMATGIKTVILFLRKRPEKIRLNCESDYKDACRDRNVVVAISGKKDMEKRFLGYEFSNRRGSEGIKIRQKSCLLDKDNPTSNKHISSYMLANMRDDPLPDVDPTLKECLKVIPLEDLFHWGGSTFSNAFVFENYKLSYPETDKLVSLRSVIDEIDSGGRPKGGVSEFTSGAWSLGGEHIDEDICEIAVENMRYVPVEHFNKMRSGIVKDGNILVNKDGARTGKVALFRDNGQQEVCVNEHLYRICADEGVVRQKYLFYFMVSDYFQQQVIAHAHQKSGQPGLNMTHIERIRFLLLNKAQQDNVIEIIEKRWDGLVGKSERRQFVTEVFADLGLTDEHT